MQSSLVFISLFSFANAKIPENNAVRIATDADGVCEGDECCRSDHVMSRFRFNTEEEIKRVAEANAERMRGPGPHGWSTCYKFTYGAPERTIGGAFVIPSIGGAFTVPDAPIYFCCETPRRKKAESRTLNDKIPGICEGEKCCQSDNIKERHWMETAEKCENTMNGCGSCHPFTTGAAPIPSIGGTMNGGQGSPINYCCEKDTMRRQLQAEEPKAEVKAESRTLKAVIV